MYITHKVHNTYIYLYYIHTFQSKAKCIIYWGKLDYIGFIFYIKYWQPMKTHFIFIHSFIIRHFMRIDLFYFFSLSVFKAWSCFLFFSEDVVKYFQILVMCFHWPDHIFVFLYLFMRKVISSFKLLKITKQNETVRWCFTSQSCDLYHTENVHI